MIVNKEQIDKFLWDHRKNGCTAIKSPLKDAKGLEYNEAWIDNITGERIDIIYEDDPEKSIKALEAGVLVQT